MNFMLLYALLAASPASTGAAAAASSASPHAAVTHAGGALVPAAKPAQAKRASRARRSVTLYGTSWCPYCRKAREYLRWRGVAFTDRDIEKDPAADREMAGKERAAGVAHEGVPVLDINGTLFEGFNADVVDQALAR